LHSRGAHRIRGILLDIEGTTTPIDFVFKTLFPFAAARAEGFLRENFAAQEIQELLMALETAHAGDVALGAPRWPAGPPAQIVAAAGAYVRWLIARDSKITALKSLQGKIWEQGFLSGELKGEVYSDVAPAFARWRAQQKTIAIFSSGSVLAQKLLFAYSTAGDLSSHLSAYFDTATGPKRDQNSYRTIAAALRLRPQEILFVSDVAAELDAAALAPLSTALALRPGTAAPQTSAHPVIRGFDELFPDSEGN
jgi:enolase-phosphatase E1